MEIRFENLTYCRGQETDSPKIIINNLSYIFTSERITGVINNNDDYFGKLITAIELPTSGEVYLNNLKIEKNTHINNVDKLRKDVTYIKRNPGIFSGDTVYKEIAMAIKNFTNGENVEKKVNDCLKLVGLNSNCLDKNPMVLSYSSQKKVQLAISLCHNPKVIIFDNYEKGFNYRDQDNFKKMLRKLKNQYHKTIILISNDTSFLLDLIDEVLVLYDGEKKLSGDKSIFFNREVYNYVDAPKIVEFINSYNQNGHNLLPYTDIKELIKAVYRDAK